MALPQVNVQNMPQSGGGFWMGNPAQVAQFGKYNQGQTGAMNQMLQMGLSGMQRGSDFAPIASEARRQFQTSTLPSLAERFGNLGGMRSSGFANMLQNAGTGLESQLAALQSQHNLGMMPYYNQMMQMAMSPQYETSYIQQTPGFLQGAGEGFMKAGGEALGEKLPDILASAAQYGGPALAAVLSMLFPPLAPVFGAAGAGIGALGALGKK